jgi:hypothetical protein
MAKNKTTSVCYNAPNFKKGDKDGYNILVRDAQRQIEDAVKAIYDGEFPTDEKCSKRIHAFTGCTPLYLPDKQKDKHLEEIRSAMEEIFMAGRMFGLSESRFEQV